MPLRQNATPLAYISGLFSTRKCVSVFVCVCVVGVHAPVVYFAMQLLALFE
jgi:hypothetical protein